MLVEGRTRRCDGHDGVVSYLRSSQKFYRRLDFFEKPQALVPSPFSFRGSPSLGAET